ncbi:basic-leucine zipper transcription factor A-like [Scylla paramamosain]|uniref:basic-leucine zipper transcription factor A-like n=1 Tax=Scylla paramamosain TaxID=85552 RepID=UPI003082ACA9
MAPPDPLPLAPHRRLGPRDSDLIPDDQALALMPDAASSRYEEAQLGDLDDPHTSYRLKHLISELAEAIAAAEALDGGAYGGPLPAELAEALAAAEGLEGGDGRPLPADVAEALAEAEAAAVMGGGVPGMWQNRDRYMMFTDYVSRPGGEANNNNNRKARDSRNSRSVTNPNNNNPNNNNNNNSLTSSTTTSTGTSTAANNDNNNNNNMNHSSGMFKRAWPHNFSRRRNSGLSLSIDASMKVLREALYLEIARKKQRQQLQRAQHNKALLNTIGKRDVASQLVGGNHGAALENARN